LSIYRTLKQRGHKPARNCDKAVHDYLTTAKLPPLPTKALQMAKFTNPRVCRQRAGFSSERCPADTRFAVAYPPTSGQFHLPPRNCHRLADLSRQLGICPSVSPLVAGDRKPVVRARAGLFDDLFIIIYRQRFFGLGLADVSACRILACAILQRQGVLRNILSANYL